MSGPTAYFWSGEALRSRSVAEVVLTGRADIPALPPRLLADWQREMASNVVLAPGDVEPLPLARARTRWPQYRACVQAAIDWTGSVGLTDVLAASDIALMACRGARYHHDADQYGASAFCNLFLSEDKQQDVLFAGTGQRIALVRGTLLVFDTAVPHAVVRRGRDKFEPGDFADGQDAALQFLTWEMPIADVHVAKALGIRFDVDPATAGRLDEEQVRLAGTRVRPCPDTGIWLGVG